MSGTVVGTVEDPRRLSYMEWKIPNYFYLCQKADTFFISPSFYFSDGIWCLKIFPNGERLNESTEWVGLYLNRIDSKTQNISLNFNIGIKCDGEDDFQKNDLTFYFTSQSEYGCSSIIHRTELFRRKHMASQHGILTVFCTLELIHDCSFEVASQTTFADSVSTLCEDFHALLQRKQKSDVTIKVKNQSFQAHKLILGARSCVFAAMFEHAMIENDSGVVNIIDCEPDIFQSFLVFMYTGKIVELTSDNVTGLFSLADKYNLGDLKEKCLDFMKQNLSLDLVCDVLDVADKHDETELKITAKQLLAKNIKKIMHSDRWILFIRDNPILATEILMTVIPDKSYFQ